MSRSANGSPGTLQSPDRDWICCQLGAREHYAIPVHLHRQGRLKALLTDAWRDPATPRLVNSRRLAERFHPALAAATVHHFTAALLGFEAKARFWARDRGWSRIMARNEWFQDRVVAALSHHALLHSAGGPAPTVMAYSYAARRIFQYAQSQGARTVLCQIDPGPLEDDIVAGAVAGRQHFKPDWQPVPPRYWELWRQECSIADRIIVNSAWSREALLAKGIGVEKIEVLPLCYEAPAGLAPPPRQYPSAFTPARPLRVLFLGSLIIRKGIVEAVEAARRLAGQPVEFTFIGPPGITLPAELSTASQIRWRGAVPRSEAARHYADADVFLFPSISDGFGLTQLEAMAAGLPVIASQRCGDVVIDRRNGLRLPAVTAPAICDAVSWCLEHPEALGEMSRQAVVTSRGFLPDVVLSKLVESRVQFVAANLAS